MNNMKMHTPNRADENYRKLKELFPNAITEIMNENGELVRAIDKEVLMQEISCEVIDGREERYQFTWPDKKKSMLLANSPTTKTLRPYREESVDFDNTENLYIEGDNLEVLKLLQETYLGKIKMIYIDPPYNTGHDFVYEDDFSMTVKMYIENSNNYDKEGNRLFQNSDSNGRFHTDWLNMIYPRLKLTRDLLTEDGVIFISIDDNEIENLKKVCDEIFGSSNFLSQFCWQTDGNFDNQAKIKVCHQYILMYAKNSDSFPAPPVIDPSVPSTSKLYKKEIRNTIIKNGPKNPISSIEIPSGFPCEFQSGVIEPENVEWPQYNGKVIVADGMIVENVIATSGWASKSLLLEFISNSFKSIKDGKGQLTRFVITKTGAIEAIKERSDVQSHVISVLQKMGGSQKASASLGGLAAYFDFPKPVELIKYLIKMNYGKDFICLDYFSGSATTAHAVMQLNAEDGGNRKFIMVQLPEETGETSKAYQNGYTNICEIGKARIKNAGERIKADFRINEKEVDVGYRVLKCESSNMKDVYYNPNEYEVDFFTSLTDNIKEDRSAEDLLFQVMLDLGVELSSKIEENEIAGKKVFDVACGFLIACFDKEVNEETIKAVAKKKPYYFVMRDSSMANDSVATNFEQIFATYSPDTVRKVL